MMEHRQLVGVSSVKSSFHLSTPELKITAQSDLNARVTAGEHRSIGFRTLPLQIRLTIWEETWPHPRVIEVSTLSDEDSESGIGVWFRQVPFQPQYIGIVPFRSWVPETWLAEPRIGLI